MKESFAYGLEFMLTLAKMQNNSTLKWTKYDIWDWSFLKLIQAFHTVHIFCIGCSGPVVRSLTATYWFYIENWLLGQNTWYTELCEQYENAAKYTDVSHHIELTWVEAMSYDGYENNFI